MADVVNRTTLEVRASVNTPDFAEPTWKVITASEKSAVSSVPPKYRKIDAVSDQLREKTATEKDAENLVTDKVAKKTALRIQCFGYIGQHYDGIAQIGFAAYHSDSNAKGLVNRLADIAAVVDWVKTVIDHLHTKYDEVDSATTVAAVDLVAANFTQFDATDPAKTLKSAFAITT